MSLWHSWKLVVGSPTRAGSVYQMTASFVNAMICAHAEVHLEELYLTDAVLQCFSYV